MATKSVSIAICLSIAALSIPAQADPTEQLVACKNLVLQEKRLECYDTLVNRFLAEQQIVIEKKAKIAESTKIAVEPSRAIIDEKRRRQLAQELKEIEETSYHLTVVKVLRDARKNRIYVTDNGQRYRDLSGRPAGLKVGEEVITDTGFMGSKFFRSTSGKRIKVKLLKQ